MGHIADNFSFQLTRSSRQKSWRPFLHRPIRGSYTGCRKHSDHMATARLAWDQCPCSLQTRYWVQFHLPPARSRGLAFVTSNRLKNVWLKYCLSKTYNRAMAVCELFPDHGEVHDDDGLTKTTPTISEHSGAKSHKERYRPKQICIAPHHSDSKSHKELRTERNVIRRSSKRAVQVTERYLESGLTFLDDLVAPSSWSVDN